MAGRLYSLVSLLAEIRAAGLVGDEQGKQRLIRRYGRLLIEATRELEKAIQDVQKADHEPLSPPLRAQLQEYAILLAHDAEQTEAMLDDLEGT